MNKASIKMKMCAIAALCATAAALVPSTADALGVGVYGMARKGRRDANVAPVGFGALLDTNLSRDKLLNFRFQIGYGSTMQNEDVFASLGFGLIRTPMVRFWLGPQAGVSFRRNDTLAMPSFGLVAGINLNPGDRMTLSLDGGVRYLVMSENYDGGNVGWRKPEPFACLSVLFRFDEASGGSGSGDTEAVPAGGTISEGGDE